MKTVEAGGKKENRRIDSAPIELEWRIGILKRLAPRERHAQKNREAEAHDERPAVAVQQAMVRPGHGSAGQQQQHRVQERQVERVKGPDAFGRPHRHSRTCDVAWIQGEVKERPEEADEEHHFRSDEEQHAVPEPKANDRAVQPRSAGLAQHVQPPQGSDQNCANQAGTKHPVIAIMRREDDPQHDEPGAHGRTDRPRARIDDMIGLTQPRIGFRRRVLDIHAHPPPSLDISQPVLRIQSTRSACRIQTRHASA